MAPPVLVDVEGPWDAIGSDPGTCAGCEAGALRPDVAPSPEETGAAVLLLAAIGVACMDTGLPEDFKAAAAAEADADGLRADDVDFLIDAMAARAEDRAPPSRGTEEIRSWRVEGVGAEERRSSRADGIEADGIRADDTGVATTGAAVTGATTGATTGAEIGASRVTGAAVS